MDGTSVARRSVAGVELIALQGDITREATDAIVNAANSSLMGGGGVDGAIHRAGGPAILEACKAIVAGQGPLPTGQAVITPGGRLPARWVIHTVGPVWRGGSSGEPGFLRSCYFSSLALAVERGLRTVAFPSISTGAYRFPIERAAPIAVQAVADFIRERAASSQRGGASFPLQQVRFVLFSPGDLQVYRRALETLPGDGQGWGWSPGRP